MLNQDKKKNQFTGLKFGLGHEVLVYRKKGCLMIDFSQIYMLQPTL